MPLTGSSMVCYLNILIWTVFSLGTDKLQWMCLWEGEGRTLSRFSEQLQGCASTDEGSSFSLKWINYLIKAGKYLYWCSPLSCTEKKKKKHLTWSKTAIKQQRMNNWPPQSEMTGRAFDGLLKNVLTAFVDFSCMESDFRDAMTLFSNIYMSNHVTATC